MKNILLLFILIISASSQAITIKDDCKNQKIRIFTKKYCSFCIKLRNLLDKNNINYENIEITGNVVLYSWLISSTKQYTVPFVYFGTDFVGGYTEFVQKCKKSLW